MGGFRLDLADYLKCINDTLCFYANYLNIIFLFIK